MWTLIQEWKFFLELTLDVVTLGAVLFWRSWASQKGKNLATKQDIAAITREIEAVKAEYSERQQRIEHQHHRLLEQQTRHHQLKLAALDRRLAAHQGAYALWWELELHGCEGDTALLTECHTWWRNNCLYLDADAREAFNQAFHAARVLPLLMAGGPQEHVQSMRDVIRQAGEVIVKAVELPSLGENELPDPPPSNGSRAQVR